jgi:hypothetical protein
MVKVRTAFFLILLSLYAHSQKAASPLRETVTVPISLQYKNPSFLKKFFLGRNYRAEWETPVSFPVFRINQSGMTIEELGGGQQTKSLQMKDKQGRTWVLRTVDKDVEKALPPQLRRTLAQKVTQDMVSGAHPYAPLTIPTLAHAIGVIVPEPTFYLVPDDPALGQYRSLFANSICMLEQKEPTPDRSETENTEDMIEELLEENDHLIIQQAVLKARLLDMLVADWDRHADQWRWAKRDSGKVEYYYAIPRDRDQAYFYSQGFLVRLAKVIALRHLVGFQDDLDQVKNLNYKSWEFDRTFLNQLDRNDWETTIRSVQAALTDDVIHKAVSKMPPAIYALNGVTIEKKLRGRRDELLEDGLKYYEYISRYALVNGTEEAECFRISGNGDSLIVQVHDLKGGKEGRKIYKRVFRPEVTKQLTLQGFGGNDRFIVEDNAKAPILANLYGGEGKDEYNMGGTIKNIIYEKEGEENAIEKNSRTKIKKDKQQAPKSK